MRTLYVLTMETEARNIATRKRLANDEGEGEESAGYLELTEQELAAFKMALHSLWEVTVHFTNDGTDGNDATPENGRIGRVLRRIVEDFNEDVVGWTDTLPRTALWRLGTQPPEKSPLD
jgi:hypothetical protein